MSAFALVPAYKGVCVGIVSALYRLQNFLPAPCASWDWLWGFCRVTIQFQLLFAVPSSFCNLHLFERLSYMCTGHVPACLVLMQMLVIVIVIAKEGFGLESLVQVYQVWSNLIRMV
jgi:hypothetical protein